MGGGLHLRLDLAGLRVRDLRHRRLRAAHRRLAGQQPDADRFRFGRAGTGTVRTACRARRRFGTSQRQQLAARACIRYSGRLAEADIEPSVGSTGDCYDIALAEKINGLFKTEIIHRRGEWKSPVIKHSTPCQARRPAACSLKFWSRVRRCRPSGRFGRSADTSFDPALGSTSRPGRTRARP